MRRNFRFEYDAKVDAAYLTLARGRVAESEEVQPGVIVDFSADDRLLGVEILRLAKRFGAKVPARGASRPRKTARTS